MTSYSRIAMVGVSGNPTRASYRALVHMKSKGYTVYPVNPSYDEILGLKCYKSLLDIQATSRYRRYFPAWLTRSSP